MVDEVELYRQNKQAKREPAPAESALQAPSEAEEYIVRKKQGREKATFEATTRLQTAGNPDENAANDQLARDYQTKINPEVAPPTSFVEKNKDRMAADIERKSTSTALSSSPMLTRWLNNEGNARLAADDVPALAGVEAGLGHAKNALKRGVVDRFNQVDAQISSDLYLYSAEQYGKTFADRYKSARGENYGYFFGKPLAEGEGVKADGTADFEQITDRGDDQIGAFFSAAVGTVVDWGNRLGGGTPEGDVAIAADMQRQAADAVVSASQTPISPTAQRAMDALQSDTPLSMGDAVKRTLDLAVNDPSALAAMVAEVGIESVGSMIPAAVVTAVTRNPAAGAATMGATSYTVERNLAPMEFFNEKGFDLTKPDEVQRLFSDPELMQEAAEKGHTRGLIIGALDLVSGGLAGKVFANNPAVDAALQALVQGGLGGGGEGLAQYATEGEVDFGEVIIEALAEFSTAPIDVAVIGARKLGAKKEAAQANDAKIEAVTGLSDSAKASKLRERSPEKFREFIESATADGDLETMYIPADDFTEFFQSQGVEIEAAVEVLPGVTMDQVRRAQSTGEDITIPTATYMERIAGSDMDDFVMDNVKFAPQEMTPKEARTFHDNEQMEEARVSAQQEAFRVTQTAEEAAKSVVYDDMVDQLVSAGRSRVAAQQEAQLIPAAYAALAQRTGTSIDELIAKYPPPKVRGPQTEELQGVQVDAITRDIAGMRERMRVRAMGGNLAKDAENATPENAYLDAVEQSVMDAGLDPATATDEEIRAAVAPNPKAYSQKAFHGGKENFAAFSLSEAGFNDLIYGHGVYLTTTKEIGEHYAITNWRSEGASDGFLYNVDIADEGWAVWEDTVQHQPTKIREALTKILGDTDGIHTDKALGATFGSVYGTLTTLLGSAAKVSGLLNDAGVKGHTKKRAGKYGGQDFVVFDPDAVTIDSVAPVDGTRNPVAEMYENGPTYAQNTFDPNDANIYAQEERGRITLPKDMNGQAVIDLFKTADLSTFLHESSHFFLSVMNDMAAQDSTTEVGKMIADTKEWWKTNAKDVARDGGNGLTEEDVLRYLDAGTTGNKAKDIAVDVGTQEQWARAFETYLMEGKAPTSELRAAFEQFRAWLMVVYKKMKGDLNVEVTDDIRQVFDMLLATDEEIANANVDNNGDMISATAAELGVSEEDYAKLAELHQEAQDQSAAKTIQASMAPIRRMRDEQYKVRHAEIKAEVAEEVNAKPVYRAVEWMGNKRWIGATEQPKIPNGMRLNKEQLVERYGPGVLRTLPRGSFRVYTVEGMDIDEAAGWFGFTSGDEMVQAMENAPKREAVIANETDRRAMNELAKEESVAEAAAMASVAFHTDKRGDYIAAELRTLNLGLGKGPAARTSTASYARQVAKRTINGMKARDAVASNRYLAAERRAAERAQEAFAAGDKAKAADFKRQQLFNHMMFGESRRVTDEVGKTERLAKRLASKGTRKNLAPAYIGAIDDILSQYDFRKLGPGKEQNRENMLAYVEMMKEAGRENELAIPQHVLDNAKAAPYMTLPVEQLRGVQATLKNIESTARRAQKLIDAKGERDMEAVANDFADAFAANVKVKPPSRVETTGERRKTSVRQFFNLVLNADTLLREIDGFPEGEGPVYNHLKQGLDEATARLQVRREEAAHSFEELYSVYETKERNEMAVAKFIPELGTSMAKWDLISIVLNMGNEANIQRLTDDRVKGSFTPAQLEAVIAGMDKRDLDFAQSVWNYVDSFYAEIAARETRVTGVAPTKVIPQELQTPHGAYKGGYFPLKYDPRLSDKVANETTEEIMGNMRAGRFGKAQTANGHTKERAASSGRAVLLDIGVLHGHINTVLHDLEMSEQVTNTWRILQDPRVKGLFLDSGKQADHQSLEMWVQDTASGQVNSADVISKSARFLKSGFTVSKLAFNLSTVAVQLTGIAQSMVVIGKKDFTKGAIEYIGRGLDTTGKIPRMQAATEVINKSPFMAERETTFNKDIYDVVGDIKVGPKAGVYKRAMQNYIGPASFYLMQKVQFYGVDMPTWLGAYNKALRETGNDEHASIQAADRAVARAQASGIFSDRSAIERGTLTPTIRQNDVVRMFTALGSYMFAKANVAYERTGKTDFKSPTEVLSYTLDMALLFTVEAIMYGAIKGTLPGMGDDDDESWAAFLAKETALSVMSTMPFIRDAASPLQGFSGGGSYGSIMETLTKPFLQATQGEIDKAFVKSLVDSGGMLLHLPSSQSNRIIDAWWRQSEGEDVAPIEYIMGKR